MNHSTASILQRVPAILAVTAASYGLPLQTQVRRPPSTIPGPTMREAAATHH